MLAQDVLRMVQLRKAGELRNQKKKKRRNVLGMMFGYLDA